MGVATMLRLARFIPKHGRLLYCLYRDPRTPLWWKGGLGALLVGVVWNPLVNLPEDIPIVGQVEVIGLTILAARFFLGIAPRDLVGEHDEAIREGSSIFHEDLHRALERAGQLRDRSLG